MRLATKKIVAKEFLILFYTIVIMAIAVFGILGFNGMQYLREESAIQNINAINEEIEKLQRDTILQRTLFERLNQESTLQDKKEELKKQFIANGYPRLGYSESKLIVIWIVLIYLTMAFPIRWSWKTFKWALKTIKQ